MHESNACFWRHCKTEYAKYLDNPEATRLEVGSLNINGSIRDLLGGCKEHIGVDFRPGPCVDVVSLAHDMDFGRQFDAVISASMLEHDPFWEKSVENMVRHLNDDGILILSWGAAKNPPHGAEEVPEMGELMSVDGGFHSLPAGLLLHHLESLGVYIHQFRYEGNCVDHQFTMAGNGMGEVCLVAFKNKVFADGERVIDKLLPEDDVVCDWLEEQVAKLNCQLESCRKNNASLRKQLNASRRDEARRFRDQQDYVPYGDDDYDR